MDVNIAWFFKIYVCAYQYSIDIWNVLFKQTLFPAIPSIPFGPENPSTPGSPAGPSFPFDPGKPSGPWEIITTIICIAQLRFK